MHVYMYHLPGQHGWLLALFCFIKKKEPKQPVTSLKHCCLSPWQVQWVYDRDRSWRPKLFHWARGRLCRFYSLCDDRCNYLFQPMGHHCYPYTASQCADVECPQRLGGGGGAHFKGLTWSCRFTLPSFRHCVCSRAGPTLLLSTAQSLAHKQLIFHQKSQTLKKISTAQTISTWLSAFPRGDLANFLALYLAWLIKLYNVFWPVCLMLFYEDNHNLFRLCPGSKEHQ